MDIAENLIFITISYLISIFNLMMLVESDILLKNHVSYKILRHSFIPTIYENLKSVFLLI